MVNSSSIQSEAIWDVLAHSGKQCVVVGVPPSYPPRKVQGVNVGCFLTPDTKANEYTYPPSVKQEIEAVVGDYPVDVKGYRTDNKAWLRDQIYEMTRKHFEVIRYLMDTQDWDYFQFVEIGLDRIHHGFWKFMDTEHRKYEPGNRFEQAIHDYYVHLDALIGGLLRHADDDTLVLVVSDHGAKRLDGGIRVNEWLRREGLLALAGEPDGVTTPEKLGIDWSRTTAWGDGGYYARIFLNVEGREPNGTVPAADYERVRADLARRLEAIPDENGNPIPTKAYTPEELYEAPEGVPPDLIVVFGDLLWRSVGTIGGDEGIHTFENDTGPDDANHAQDGMWIAAGAGVGARGTVDAQLLDIAPTVLELLGLPVPEDMRGHSRAPELAS